MLNSQFFLAFAFKLIQKLKFFFCVYCDLQMQLNKHHAVLEGWVSFECKKNSRKIGLLFQFPFYTHLCCDSHAARNVHTENNHCILQVLVVVFALPWQVKVVTAHTCTLPDAHLGQAFVDTVLKSTELAHPQLSKREAIQNYVSKIRNCFYFAQP